MNLADRKGLRLFTLCLLYVAQGIPWGFTATTIPAYLAERGLERGAIGLALVTTTLPYSFKWVWGVVIDAFTISRFGRRRPWIVLAQLMMAATILSMLAIPDLTLDLKLLAWTIMIHTVFNALQDVAVDALAVDLLDEDERGRANGLMYASKYGGGFIGGAVLAWIIASTSLSTALLVQAAILVAIMFVPMLVRERAAQADGSGGRPLPSATLIGQQRVAGVLRSLAIVFSVRSVAITALLVLGLTFPLGVLIANANALFTQVLGWTAKQYTGLTGGWGLVVGLCGAVAGGFLSDRFGRRRIVAIASILLAANWLVFGLGTSLWTNHVFAYASSGLEAGCTAVMMVGVFALCMDVSWPAVAASQFTAYMAMSNFSSTLGYRTAALVEPWLDYASCYLAAAAVQIAITALLLFIDPGQTRRELPLPEATPIPTRGIVVCSFLFVVMTGLTAWIVSGLI